MSEKKKRWWQKSTAELLGIDTDTVNAKFDRTRARLEASTEKHRQRAEELQTEVDEARARGSFSVGTTFTGRVTVNPDKGVIQHLDLGDAYADQTERLPATASVKPLILIITGDGWKMLVGYEPWRAISIRRFADRLNSMTSSRA